MSVSQEHSSDERLLSLFYKTKDQQWLGVLLERYTMLLLGVCMKYLKNEENARDAVQQVYLKVLSAAAKTKIINFGAWVYQIAKNECYTRLRQDRQLMTELADTFEAEESLPIEVWLAEENKFEQLEKALNEIKIEQKNCITLFYLQGKTYQEITSILKMTDKEVKSHIQNGKRNLKIKLASACHQEERGGQDEKK